MPTANPGSQPTPHVVRVGTPESGYRIVGPFRDAAAAAASPHAQAVGAEVVPLVDPGAPVPPGANAVDRRPYCGRCGCRDVETVEIVRWLPDGSIDSTTYDSWTSDAWCPQCEEDNGAVYDPEDVGDEEGAV